MKKGLLFLTLWLSLGVAHAQTTTAADSVAEQKMIQRVGTDLCRQMEQENAKAPLAKLTKNDAQQLFVRLFTSTVTNDKVLLKKIEGMGSEAQAYGERLGRQVAFLLMRECPVSQPLIMKLGGEEMNKQQAISPEEAQLLTPIAAALCQDLQPRVTEMKKMPATQRMEVLGQAFEKNLKAHAQGLSKFYGADVFLDSEQMKTIGVKISAQMALQCPEVLLLFVDMNKVNP